MSGAYLREIAGAHPGTGSLTCKTLASGPKRSSVEEIRERDFIFHNGSPDHIQIIGQIRQIDDSGYLHCNICEARSPKLMGPQTLTWKIKRDGSKWKMYRTAEGSTNAIGAEVYRDWISRNAMVG